MSNFHRRAYRLILYGMAISAIAFAGDPALRRDYPIIPAVSTAVRFSDGFWSRRIDVNRTVSIPHNIKKCQETGRIDNFVFAAGLREGKYRGYQFNDSDVFKLIEGASFSLMLHPDPALEATLDSVITFIAAAQEPDGYLYTPKRLITPEYSPPGGKERWVGIKDASHELYNVGHLYEAAVAHFKATGKRTLLDVALRNADLICTTFAPGGRGEVPGHQVIEMGLCKLYRVTGNERYLATAKHFLDHRGDSTTHEPMGTYNQDHVPLREQTEAVGHAVRAAYMYAGIADVAALTGDSSYVAILDRIWNDVVGGKIYVTGGIGSVGTYEGFGPAYALPNRSAYCETCASIALVYWSERMFLTHGDAQYIDVLERTLYNSLLAGIGMNGSTYFYPNPLESFGGAERPDWYSCACCPPNAVRLLPVLGSYVYAHRGDDLFINLFAAGEGSIQTGRGNVTVKQETRYPWDGAVKIVLEPEHPGEFTVNLRIPGWARSQTVPGELYQALDPMNYEVALAVNGKSTGISLHKGYARIRRAWQWRDEITLSIPMPVERLVAHPRIDDDQGRFALQRGPIVYCLEGVDTPDRRVMNLVFPDTTRFTAEYQGDLLNGVVAFRATGIATRRNLDGTIALDGAKPVMAVPYYAWAHRGKSEMTVWPARERSAARPLPAPTLAWRSSATASQNIQTDPLRDQFLPRSSSDGAVPYTHWWPKKGTTEWVQYDFPAAERVSRVEVYWFDDTGTGECRVPKSWRILYKNGDAWKPANVTGSMTAFADRVNVVSFDPVMTGALRLEVTSQPGFSTGLFEWKVE